MTRSATWLWLLLAVATATRADDESRLRARLAPEVAPLVLAIVRDARAASLPAEPLVARALEGASRGVDAAAIVAGVRRQAAALAHAREALGPGSTPDEIVAGGSALMAGVPADTLVRLRASRSGALVIPLVVLCDLVARGVPAGPASDAVLIAARAGATDAALLRIRERVHARIESGAPAAGSAGEVLRQWLREGPSRTAGKGKGQ